MRKKLIVGNWKMNLDRAQSVALAAEISQRLVDGGDTEVAVCPPYVYLDSVGQVVRNTSVALGAQNVYYESSGAFTGEVSPAMLADLGCRYVIVGHSERRQFLAETDDHVNRKARAVLQHGMLPIVCLGETLQEREAGLTLKVLEGQFRGSLAGIPAEQATNLTIAYEPVWAIGTGKVATCEQAQEVHAALRKLLRSDYNDRLASKVRLLYGGSVKGSNAGELMSCRDIDGALVGGASLTLDGFLAIIAAAG